MNIQNDEQLLAEAYVKIGRTAVNPGSKTYIGFMSHEDYTNIYVSHDPRVVKMCEYAAESAAPVFVARNNDESIEIAREGPSIDEIVKQVNAEDWGNETPNNFDARKLAQFIKSTEADKDSSEAYYLIQANPLKVLAKCGVDINLMGSEDLDEMEQDYGTDNYRE